MEAHATLQLTRAEYIEQSRSWDVRHEWVNGRAYAMGGGTPLHSAIKVNTTQALANRLASAPCRVADADQRLFVSATEGSFYPDITVVCGEWEMARDDPYALLNPKVLVEVLSPSTADYDRGAKLEHYLQIPSLEHVLLIDPDPDKPNVLHYRRQSTGWLRTTHTEGSIDLDAVGVRLPISEIYTQLEHVPRV